MIGTEIHQSTIQLQGRSDMTDLRIDPFAFLGDVDRNDDSAEAAKVIAGRGEQPQPDIEAIEREQQFQADEQARLQAEAEETAARLAKAGLDRVPTVDEAKALLDARKAEIRREVLLQADARDWCYDGTRQVCANLRLAKPGDRETYKFRTTVTMVLEVQATGFTEAGAVERLKRQHGGSGRSPYLSSAWLSSHLYGSEVIESSVEPIALPDGTVLAFGDKKEEVA